MCEQGSPAASGSPPSETDLTSGGIPLPRDGNRVTFQVMVRKIALVCLLFVPLVIGAGCGLRDTQVEGELVSFGGSTLDDWVFAPDECWSGELVGFFGVYLESSADPDELWLQFYREPSSGWEHLSIAIPGTCERVSGGVRCEVLELDHESDCDLYETRLRSSGEVVDGVRNMFGELSLDCRLPDGGELHGSIRFERCH
jgi:hypothetical protein